jgi:hypothetical protein
MLKEADFIELNRAEFMAMLMRPIQHFFSFELYVTHLGCLDVEDEVELHDKPEISHEERAIVSRAGA